MALLVLGRTRLGTRNETSNILVLRCFGHVELSRIVIVTLKLITKLGFGFGIMPQPRTLRKFPIFSFLFCLILCG